MILNRVFLIGFMGSGKTTIGRRLAVALEKQFIDLDVFIENRYHKSINQLFDEYGEEVFREIENRALAEIISFENVVISTGGGTPCFKNNMDLMNKNGITVYLKVSSDELASRLNHCKQSRPLIKDKDIDELNLFVKEHLSKRDCYYNQSSIIFNSEKLLTVKDLDHLTSGIISKLVNYQKL